jgi:hypothetical protein
MKMLHPDLLLRYTEGNAVDEAIRAKLASVKTERMRAGRQPDHGCAHADH